MDFDVIRKKRRLYAVVCSLGRGGAAASAATTWNPADKDAGAVLSNGNLKLTGDGTADWSAARGTSGKSSGKWYFEVVQNAAGGAGGGPGAGIADSTANLSTYLGQDAASAGYFYNGFYGTSNSYTGGPTLAVNDVLGIAVDIGARKVWFSKNGAYQNGDPAVGSVGLSIAGMGVTIYPLGESDGSGAITANFGATAFTTSPPSGFTAWG